MFTHDQLVPWPKDVADLAKCSGRIRNSAQRLSHHHGVHAVLLERDLIARRANELDFEGKVGDGLCCYLVHFW